MAEIPDLRLAPGLNLLLALSSLSLLCLVERQIIQEVGQSAQQPDTRKSSQKNDLQETAGNQGGR